jgi:hypothetical protein
MSSYFPTVGIKDNQDGREIMITSTRELRIAESVRLAGRGFEGSVLDTNYWVSTMATGGTFPQGNGIISLITTTDSGSSSKIVSADIARYVSSASNQFRAISRFTTSGVTNNVRRIGAFNSNNGYLFELSGTTFSVVSRKNSSDTKVSSGFNGNISTSYTLDTSTHTFEIVYGVTTVEFYIDGELLHKMSSPSDPLVGAYSLPITLENTNTGIVTGSPQLDCRGASIARLGTFNTAPQSLAIDTATTNTLKLNAGIIKSVFYCKPVNGSTMNIYDNTAASGTKIATVAPPNGVAPFHLNFEIPFSTGLTVVTTGTASWVVVWE